MRSHDVGLTEYWTAATVQCQGAQILPLPLWRFTSAWICCVRELWPMFFPVQYIVRRIPYTDRIRTSA